MKKAVSNTILQEIERANTIPSNSSLISQELKKNPRTIVVLDDDPTGTQTVNNVPVIANWNVELIEDAFLNSPVFFILTNSRSMIASKANQVAQEIGALLRLLSEKYNKEVLVISRGDSTLRGHYPNEVNALAKGLNLKNAKHLIVPAFFEGGRYTYNNIHYVKEGNDFIPAGETPFARDNTFGYSASDMNDWLVEKGKGSINKNNIIAITTSQLEDKDPSKIVAILKSSFTYIIVNATAYFHLEQMALACLQSKTPILYRTAASFVNAITGIKVGKKLNKNDIINDSKDSFSLTIIGSYVPKTNEQLNYLKEHLEARFIKLDVSMVNDEKKFHEEISKTAKLLNKVSKQKNKNIVLYTSRTVIKSDTKTESLKIVNRVSDGLISVIKCLQHKPKYILAKGGITSSDIATKALAVKTAKVLGQLHEGVPVWQLDSNSKFPNLSYIIFPGNVGHKDTLYNIIKNLE